MTPKSDVLRTWNEIARYLGCGIRTAQRYERAFGLPVRRVAGYSGGSVIAFPKDLDYWLKQSQAKRPHPPRTRASRAGSALETHQRSILDLHRNLTELCEHIAQGRKILARQHWLGGSR